MSACPLNLFGRRAQSVSGRQAVWFLRLLALVAFNRVHMQGNRLFTRQSASLRFFCGPPLDSLYFRYRIAAMSILERAIEKLKAVETSLRGMIAEAAANGDYSSVEKLAKWAGTLGAIYDGEPLQLRVADQLVPAPDREPAANSSCRRGPGASVREPKRQKRRRYPVFAKSGDALVKIAWSKSSKSEYQHKSPRVAATALADSLVRHASGNAIVRTEMILPLKTNDGSEIPDYQVYVCLAWLRKIGAVKQNGRQGYTVKTPLNSIGRSAMLGRTFRWQRTASGAERLIWSNP